MAAVAAAPIGAGRGLGRGCSTQWSPQISTYTPLPPRSWRRWTSFTCGGKDATRALASQAGVTAGMRVLDVGGGLAGPARMLAVEYGAHVTVLDLTTDYLRAGALLTVRMGLAEQVQLCCGHALNLPFPDGSFDLVWTQNSGMQIADKVGLYREFFRVLRPAGRLAQLEPIAGPVQPPHFPLMWARKRLIVICSLQMPCAEVIRATGFVERDWHPAVTSGIDSQSRPAPRTIQSLVMGERLAAIQEARARNAAEDRLRTVLLVCERP